LDDPRRFGKLVKPAATALGDKIDEQEE